MRRVLVRSVLAALIVTVDTSNVLSLQTTSGAIRLKKIWAEESAQGATVRIEVSDPAAYVVAQPDPFTILVDVPNGRASGVVNKFTAIEKGFVTGVTAEDLVFADQPALARVRVNLSGPYAHQVRSSRGVIHVEVKRTNRGNELGENGSAEAEMSGSDAADPLPANDLPLHTLVTALDPTAALFSSQSDQAPAPKKSSPPRPTQEAAPVSGAAPQLPARNSPGLAQAKVSQADARARTVSTARRYTGHPISFDFQQADLRAVLRVFAQETGLNIVIDPAVQGTVDVTLQEVPWDQALDTILKSNKLGYSVEGNIVRIAPLTVLAEEERERQKLADAQALAGDLHVMTKTLSYARADQVRPLLLKSALSSRGTVEVDARTNTLIIRDLRERLDIATSLVASLDQPQPQVEIEARIVIMTRNAARELGVQWGLHGRMAPELANTSPLTFPNQGSLSGRTGGAPQGPEGIEPVVNLPATNPTSAIGLSLGSVNGSFNIDVALSALESSGRGRILLTPRVATQNNIEATIVQGTQIPIQTVANNTVTVTFKDATLTLRVTPQITAANTVIMKIIVENDQADFSRSVNGIPPINTQRANTEVLVHDGATTVIGGIYHSNEQRTESRTPALHRIPLLGWLFRRDSALEDTSELLIFITPRILKT